MASQEMLRAREPSTGLASSTIRRSAGSFFQVMVVRRARRLRLVDRRQHDREPAALATSRPASASCRGRAGFDIADSADRLYVATRPTAARSLVGFSTRCSWPSPASSRHRSSASSSASAGCRSNWLIRKICDGLCRDLPQHPAAAGHLLLVSRRAVGAAAAARQHRAAVRLLSQQPRLLSSRSSIWGDGSWLIVVGAGRRHRHEHGSSRASAAPAPDGDRPAVPGVLDVARPDRRPAAARPSSPPACR